MVTNPSLKARAFRRRPTCRDGARTVDTVFARVYPLAPRTDVGLDLRIPIDIGPSAPLLRGRR